MRRRKRVKEEKEEEEEEEEEGKEGCHVTNKAVTCQVVHIVAASTGAKLICAKNRLL